MTTLTPLPPNPPAAEPLVLPPIPVPLQNETPAEFNDRMLNWWRMCDIALRADCQARKALWLDGVVPQFAPTLTRIADAWDAFDVRLGDLAGALNAQPASGLTDIGAVLAFALDFARVALNKQAPEAGG